MTPVGRAAGVVLDSTDTGRAAAFWSALLGLPVTEHREDGWVTLERLSPGGLELSFQPVPEPKTAPNRLHLDVVVDDLPAATAAVLRLGGTRHGTVRGEQQPWQVMRDLDGNEFCLITG